MVTDPTPVEEGTKKLTKGEARRLAEQQAAEGQTEIEIPVANLAGPCKHGITYVQGIRDNFSIKYITLCADCKLVIAERVDNYGRRR
jgi:hypothetical protein